MISKFSFDIRKGNHKITKRSKNFQNYNQNSHSDAKQNIQSMTQNSKLFDINISEFSFIIKKMIFVSILILTSWFLGNILFYSNFDFFHKRVHCFFGWSNLRAKIHDSNWRSNKKCWQNRIWAFDCLDLCFVRAKKLKSILNSYENHLWMIWICQFLKQTYQRITYVSEGHLCNIFTYSSYYL